MVTRDELHRQIELLPEAALPEARSMLAALEGAVARPDVSVSGKLAELPLGTDEEEPFCLEDHLISKDEGWAILEEQARLHLGMSAAEFVRAWDAGEITDPDRPGVMSVVLLLPLAR